ncbi:MAG: PD40 domain-containing protein [Flavobacteriales bacterium]|nr:PD40 domain-containing protein [Flavobacteriales bacterium]
MKGYYLILLALFLAGTVSAQENPSLKPDKAFENGNYTAAIKGYEKQLIALPKDYQTHLMLGKCYIDSYIDREKAIYYLEKIKNAKNNDFEVLYFLGRAYHLNYKFDLAISAYQTLIDSVGDSSTIKIAIRQIEMCENGKKLIKTPVDVTLKNLGDTINSDAPDFNVFVDQTESILVFSSKRKRRNKAEAASADGYYTADIFMSYLEEGAWQKLKSQSNVCTPSNEEVVGLSADGKLMFLNVSGRGVTGDMVVSARRSGSFKVPVKVENTLNTNASEMTASVTQDKQTLYYGSNRDGGEGMFDIYQAKRLPDLSWALSQSVSLNINTPYNDLYPQLSPDEKTLFFASEGHNSMGGYDLFKSKWDAEKQAWGAPQNLGYPINTPGDDMHFTINVGGSMGYIATWREDSRGDLDIYSVKFNGIETKKSVIIGQINTAATIDYTGAANTVNKTKTTTIIPVKEVELEVYDSGGELVGRYATNPNTGNFVLILSPGKYTVDILAENYKNASASIEVFGNGAFKTLISKNFQLESNGIPRSVDYKDVPK